METVVAKLRLSRRVGERINWRRNLLAALMASLRTAKQPSNRLQKRYVYGDGEMALLGRTISARRVERAKTRKDRGKRERGVTMVGSPRHSRLVPLAATCRISLAGEPIAQLVTRTNSLFRLSLFPTFGGWWCRPVAREMAGASP